jgi:pimeloyl-ACP methyl ester carboxylesterase
MRRQLMQAPFTPCARPSSSSPSTHISATLFGDRTTVAAWRSKPSWYAVSKRDRTTSPKLERFLAKRMKAKTIELDSGHLSLITHPRQISELILRAARHT